MNRIFASVAVLVGAVGLAAAQVNRDVIREGEGSRRTELNAMELQPFQTDILSKLSDWQNGGALTAGEISGKPVLIATWGDWYQPSKRASSLAIKMAEKYGKDGLVTILVHHERGWANATKPTAPADAVLRVAHDAAGEFRKALKVDQDPDFYLIDRAGQLRYADIQIDSVEIAVSELIAEKVDAASSLKERLATEESQIERERLKSEALKGSLKFTDIPEQNFPLPGPELFAKADWPPLPKDPAAPQSQAAPTPKLIQLPDSNWFPAKPEMKGRAILIYLWSPMLTGSYYWVMDSADGFARNFGRDIVVVGLAMDFNDINNNKLSESDRDFNKVLKKVEEIYSSKKLAPNHVLVAENGANVLSSLTTDREIYVPYFILTSSNLEARWWPIKSQDGNNTYVIGMDLFAAIRRVIDVDPAIRARQKAEDAYIKANQGK